MRRFLIFFVIGFSVSFPLHEWFSSMESPLQAATVIIAFALAATAYNLYR